MSAPNKPLITSCCPVQLSRGAVGLRRRCCTRQQAVASCRLPATIPIMASCQDVFLGPGFDGVNRPAKMFRMLLRLAIICSHFEVLPHLAGHNCQLLSP